MKPFGFLLSGLTFCILACGGLVVPVSEDEPLVPVDGSVLSNGAASWDAARDACAPRLANSVEEHACSHGTQGPFASVVPSVIGLGVSISLVHVSYELLFPEGVSEGAVEYQPARSGQHALFSSGLEILEARDRGGKALEISTKSSEFECSAFDAVRIFGAVAGQPIGFRVRGKMPKALLFVEHIDSFERPWARTCSDDF
jgi:hypothetical protein